MARCCLGRNAIVSRRWAVVSGAGALSAELRLCLGRQCIIRGAAPSPRDCQPSSGDMGRYLETMGRYLETTDRYLETTDRRLRSWSVVWGDVTSPAETRHRPGRCVICLERRRIARVDTPLSPDFPPSSTETRHYRGSWDAVPGAAPLSVDFSPSAPGQAGGRPPHCTMHGLMMVLHQCIVRP